MKDLGEFEDRYKLLKNRFDKYAAYEGAWFETYGEEELFVRNADPEKVWTIVEGDESLWVIAGFHLVNRLGYLIAKSSWKSSSETYRFD